MAHRDVVLVSAPNAAGERFAKALKCRGIPFAVIVNNMAEYERVRGLGAARIIVVNTAKEGSWVIPGIEVGRVFLFEKSLNLCCRYAQICRSWTSKPICVVTGSSNPRHVYKGLGVDYVIHSNARDFAFLITEDLISRT